jgi:hypothetical protein
MADDAFASDEGAAYDGPASEEASGKREEAEAAPPVAARAKGGLFERAKEKIASYLAPKQEADAEAASSEVAPFDRPALRRLVARLAKLGEGRIALTLRVDALGLELDYEGVTVQITLDDGSTIAARLAADESAYEASYAPGAELRLVIEHAALAGRRITELVVSLPKAGCEVVAT